MADQQTDPEVVVLRRIIESHPLSQQEIQARAGLSRNYLAWVWSRGGVTLKNLTKLLAAMEVSSEEFFRRVNSCDPAEHLETSGKAGDKNFRKAMRTVFLGGDGEVSTTAPPEDLAVMARVALPEDLERMFRTDPRWRSAAAAEVAVEHLALVRYRDPRQSIAMGGALLGNVAQSGHRDSFVAVARSLIEAYRLGGWLSDAVQMGRWLVASGMAQGDRARVGTYLTTADLLVSRTNFSAALEVAYSAVSQAAGREVALELSATTSLARSLFHTGRADEDVFLRCLDMNSRATSACWRQKIAVHQFAIVWLSSKERFPEASWHLAALKDLVPLDAVYLRGYTLLAEANLMRQKQDFEAAAAAAADSVNCFLEINPFDTALASLDLIELQLSCHQPHTAMETVLQMRNLLMAHETNETAEAALAELRRIGAVAELANGLAKIRSYLASGRRLGLRPLNFPISRRV